MGGPGGEDILGIAPRETEAETQRERGRESKSEREGGEYVTTVILKIGRCVGGCTS